MVIWISQKIIAYCQEIGVVAGDRKKFIAIDDPIGGSWQHEKDVGDVGREPRVKKRKNENDTAFGIQYDMGKYSYGNSIYLMNQIYKRVALCSLLRSPSWVGECGRCI